MTEKPIPSPELQVIACGLPRTGTTTIGRALQILLGGPVLDGTADTFLHGSIEQQKDLQRLPTTRRGDPSLVPLLRKIIASHPGIVATTDSPFSQYVTELREINPNLRFVCTTRDFAGWYKSFTNIQWTYTQLAPYSRLWPRLHRCVKYIESTYVNHWRPEGSTRMLLEAPVLTEDEWLQMFNSHHEYVQRTVPKDQLLIYKVEQGWAPLCEFLGVAIPVDAEGKELPFPHEFSADAMIEWRENLLRTFRFQTAALAVCGLAASVFVARWIFPM